MGQARARTSRHATRRRSRTRVVFDDWPCEPRGAVSPDTPPSSENEEFWRDFLSGGHSKEHAARRVLKLIPQDPRCRLCAAPFSGVGAPLMRLMGKTPSDKNPNWCASCFKFMTDHHGGAEIEAHQFGFLSEGVLPISRISGAPTPENGAAQSLQRGSCGISLRTRRAACSLE